ncbi:MAG: aspartate aminotransferase [Thermoproteota archaeon]|jgi:aspartate aminotransferase
MSERELSQRVLNLNESATLKMARMSNELKASGVDVINMSLGEPDFNTPDFIKDAAKKALDDNCTRYTPVPGYPALRDAICEKLKRDNNLSYERDNIIVSTGAKQTCANIVLALINPGDEVILPTPYWVSYKEQIQFAGGNVVEVLSNVESNFKVSPEQIETQINDKTKLFIFSNPCNPSGTVYTKDELQGFASMFKKYPKVTIVSDEIYEHICFEKDYVSFGQFSEIKDQLIIVNGVSKGFAMTGWRVGYLAAPLDIAKACNKIQSQFTSGTNAMAQKATITAMEAPVSSIKNMQDTFFKRRDLIFKLISDIPEIKVNKPMGAFYIFPDIGAFLGKSFEGQKIETTPELCEYLLKEYHIGVTPGSAFGNPNNIRLSYALDDESINKAVSRLAKGLSSLS